MARSFCLWVTHEWNRAKAEADRSFVRLLAGIDASRRRGPPCESSRSLGHRAFREDRQGRGRQILVGVSARWPECLGYRTSPAGYRSRQKRNLESSQDRSRRYSADGPVLAQQAKHRSCPLRSLSSQPCGSPSQDRSYDFVDCHANDRGAGIDFTSFFFDTVDRFAVSREREPAECSGA